MKLSLIPALVLITACHGKQQLSARKNAEQTPRVVITASAELRSGLPICEMATSGTQGYVSNEKKLLVCNGLAWQEADSINRPSPLFARPRPAVRFYEWQDETNQKTWRLSAQHTVDLATLSPQLCNEGWQLPTESELSQARDSGLFEGMLARGGIAFESAWSKESLTTGRPVNLALTQGGEIRTGVYCISAKPSFAANR